MTYYTPSWLADAVYSLQVEIEASRPWAWAGAGFWLDLSKNPLTNSAGRGKIDVLGARPLPYNRKPLAGLGY